MIRLLLILVAFAFSSATRAEWHEARSRNFIVYSEGSARDAVAFAAKLERFHFALRTVHRVTAPPRVNPLRVFLLSNANDVATVAGAPGAPIAGYYVPDARALMMIGTRSRASPRSHDIRAAREEASVSVESVLLHEYAHHFMFQYFPAAYPAWYREGFAEFWGATRLLPNDVVDVGLPANDRFSTFRALGWLPLQRLLTAYDHRDISGTDVFLLYVEGWLLMRYVFEKPERRRQLDHYLALINRGSRFADAAREAFPDLERFNSELYDYAGTGRFNYVRLPFRTIDVGPIQLRTPGPAEQALMRAEIRMSQGVPNRVVAEFARDVRGTASRFPSDPFALRALAEAEYLAGNHAAAVAAADRLLAIEPNHARAMVIKGRAQIAGLRAANSTDNAAWQGVRRLIERAQQAAPNDPVVLEAVYDGYALQGVLPPDEAQNALYTAVELAPSDGELRYKLVRDFEQRDMIADAIAIIRPEALASRHHDNESDRERRKREREEERWRAAGRERRETAREMLTRLEEKQAQAQPAQPARPAQSGGQ